MTPQNAILPETKPKKKPKSDLTLAFVDSSDYVNSLAIQSQHAERIDRIRQNAVINQRANPYSRWSIIGSARGRLQAMQNQADSTKADAKASPAPDPGPHWSLTPEKRPSRTMTAKIFKKRYSGAGIGLLGLSTPTKPTTLNIVQQKKTTKSLFCPDLSLDWNIKSGLRSIEPQD